jgi:hypothetical protein
MTHDEPGDAAAAAGQDGTARPGVTAAAGRRWVAQVPGDTGDQRRLLEQLIDAAAAEPRVRWVELGGSLARGAGDRLSDIDAGLGFADADWPDGVAVAEAAVRGFGPVTDAFRQRFPGPDGAGQSWHLVTLYESGVQLSLVVTPASSRAGLPPQSVALYDADGQLGRPYLPPITHAGEADAREWACLAWVALGDLAKYVERGSAWEAHARLEEARGLLWRLWAAAQDATYPTFGLTALLDTPGAGLPPGISSTVAGLAPGDLLRAAGCVADLLDAACQRLITTVPFQLPGGLPGWVRSRLDAAGAGGR